MKITPLEVESEQFTRRLRGYDRTEVDGFKRLVAARLEELGRESTGLREELAQTKKELAELKEREKGVQEALLAARQFADEIRQQAQREAEILRAEGELAGEGLKREAERALVQLQREVAELRQQRARLIVELRSLLEGHLRLLELQSEEVVHKGAAAASVSRADAGPALRTPGMAAPRAASQEAAGRWQQPRPVAAPASASSEARPAAGEAAPGDERSPGAFRLSSLLPRGGKERAPTLPPQTAVPVVPPTEAAGPAPPPAKPSPTPLPATLPPPPSLEVAREQEEPLPRLTTPDEGTKAEPPSDAPSS